MWKRHSCLKRSCNSQLIRRVWSERDTFLLPEDITQFAGMEEIGATVLLYMSMVGFIDPATVSANSGTIADRSRLVAVDFRRQTPSLVLLIVRAKGKPSISGSSARSSCGR
ncbi:hypothetical protein Prudu_607S000500 [Prunus dulcis]|uniref:Uncharacterized protein n=1 Tax=Prunus dulcis TaxID=3755 RepID=A0A5H2XRQ1_PRUDU|nr:hypothetical protein Prudu_607S000500 [Prunus dulcis]